MEANADDGGRAGPYRMDLIRSTPGIGVMDRGAPAGAGVGQTPALGFDLGGRAREPDGVGGV